MKNHLTILIVDDERYIRDELEESLTDNDFNVYLAEKPSKAFSILNDSNIDIVILDINLPEMDGIEVLKRIKNNNQNVEVIMITAQNDIDYAIKALRLGAADFFLKPFSINDVLIAIKKTERFKNLNQQLCDVVLVNKILSENIKENTNIVGNSPEILNVIAMMNEVSKHSKTNVLVTGESGTGKELVSRGIHNLSDKKDKICYAINCAAIPENLFESELFGHIKGAFTGATIDKIGCFELTQNGTLILDEITEMPYNLQAKLLRVLEEKVVTKVGSHKLINLNSRIIATTNKNIRKLVEENKFREDLYHRLNSFLIEVPPLKEREGDIPILIDYFSQKISKKLKKKQKKIDSSVYELLKKYSFPGNVRELKNILERVLILNNQDSLSCSDFAFLNISSIQIPKEIFDFNMQSNERKLIVKALKKSSGNRLKAAKLLNITWQALDRRLKKHKIVIECEQIIR